MCLVMEHWSSRTGSFNQMIFFSCCFSSPNLRYFDLSPNCSNSSSVWSGAIKPALTCLGFWPRKQPSKDLQSSLGSADLKGNLACPQLLTSSCSDEQKPLNGWVYKTLCRSVKDLADIQLKHILHQVRIYCGIL